MYEERFYRDYAKALFSIEISYGESDLFISSDKEIDKTTVQDLLRKYYNQIESYAKDNPPFLNSLSPLDDDETAAAIIREMLNISHLTGIGPFSSVAGAIAKYVGQDLLNYVNEVIIENGGDLFLKINQAKKIDIYLGEKSNLKNLKLKIQNRPDPFGIASSSSSFGHSLNFGRADLVTVIAKNSIIADGFATSLSNRIKKEEDVKQVLEFAKKSNSIEGLLVFFEGNIFLWGALEIVN